ncbi:hypothetical protein [Thermococcus sp.]|uniref:hypothetical protein n=1 Tax=Thermococcus sp. TaxID=35749 RepID=UPI002631FE4D|nr:hypothetical protein [Thermococcus sp.]
MPFLRGKLLGNGFVAGEGRRDYVEYLLDELGRFYERVSWSGKLGKSHWKALKSFHRDILLCLY